MARPGSAVRSEGWLAPVLFWLCLVVSGALYAGASLAPKAVGYLTLRHEHYENQVRLVALERQAKYLGRVIDALERDPDFAAQLARIDFDASRPGDERIAVEPELSLDARAADEAPLRARRVPLPWYLPLLTALAEQSRYRTGMLAASAILTIVAFTFLHDRAERASAPATPECGEPAPEDGPGGGTSPPAPHFTLRRWLQSRYTHHGTRTTAPLASRES